MASSPRTTTNGGPEWMIEFFKIPVSSIPLVLGTASFEVNTIRIPLKNAFRALDEINPAVRPR